MLYRMYIVDQFLFTQELSSGGGRTANTTTLGRIRHIFGKSSTKTHVNVARTATFSPPSERQSPGAGPNDSEDEDDDDDVCVVLIYRV